MVLRVHQQTTLPMDCRNGFCTAEADRCLLRTLPRKPQLPYAAGPWTGKTAFEIPILNLLAAIAFSHGLGQFRSLAKGRSSAPHLPFLRDWRQQVWHQVVRRRKCTPVGIQPCRKNPGTSLTSLLVPNRMSVDISCEDFSVKLPWPGRY